MNNSNEISEISEINPARLVLHRMSNSPFTDVSEICENAELTNNATDKSKEHEKKTMTCGRNEENFG